MRYPLLIILALTSLSCTNVHPSIILNGSILAEPGDGICQYEIDDPVLIAYPQYNIDVPRPYEAVFAVDNQRRQLTSDIAVNRGGVEVNFAQVELQDSAGTPLALPAELPNPFRLPTNGFLPSASDPEMPGRAPIRVTVIPDAYRPSLTAGTTIVASITLFGTTVGAVEVESTPYAYRIDLCDGTCLLHCPADTDTLLPSCTPGQDIPAIYPCLCDATGFSSLTDECRRCVLEGCL